MRTMADDGHSEGSPLIDLEDDASSDGSTAAPQFMMEELEQMESLTTMTQAIIMKLKNDRYARDFVAAVVAFQMKSVQMSTYIESVLYGGSEASGAPDSVPRLMKEWAELKRVYDQVASIGPRRSDFWTIGEEQNDDASGIVEAEAEDCDDEASDAASKELNEVEDDVPSRGQPSESASSEERRRKKARGSA